jgi:hypothetical protein
VAVRHALRASARIRRRERARISARSLGGTAVALARGVQTMPRLLRPVTPTPRATVVLSLNRTEDTWIVRVAEASAGEAYETREDAVARARNLLRRRGGGRVRILGRGGRFEGELTF